jgi:malonate decarboxylase delta subunit
MHFNFSAATLVARRAHVGVVASGDLEVLIEPATDQTVRITVTTAVHGYETVWRSVIERFLARHGAAAVIEINDFGATPGMVMLRLEQALEASR